MKAQLNGESISPGRRHRGDIMSAAKRSALMARIKGQNTGPELAMAAAMLDQGWSFERHARDLPGRPDFVFRTAKLVVFVDGDFWHGWRFPLWRDKLSVKWELKIEGNRNRDVRNFARLKRSGWTVVRVWEHQVEKDLRQCISRVARALKAASEV